MKVKEKGEEGRREKKGEGRREKGVVMMCLFVSF